MRLMLLPNLLQPQQRKKPNHTQMKLKTTLIAALSLAAMATSQAFMINFGSGNVVPNGTNVGSSITIDDNNPLEVDVVGYGQVTFTFIADNNGSVESGTLYAGQYGEEPASTLEFSFGDVVQVTFGGSTEFSPDSPYFGSPFFGVVGVNSDDLQRQDVSTENDGSVWNLTYAGAENTGAGLVSVTWDIVPEPSSAALGALGMSMILLRRRRA